MLSIYTNIKYTTYIVCIPCIYNVYVYTMIYIVYVQHPQCIYYSQMYLSKDLSPEAINACVRPSVRPSGLPPSFKQPIKCSHN